MRPAVDVGVFRSALRSPSLRAAAFVVALAVLAPPARGQALQNAVEATIAGVNLRGSRIGVCMLDPATGRTLAERDADDAFIPASNMKLVTSGAALAVLGPDFRFTTALQREGDRLIVVGSGDPAFGDPKVLNEMGLGVERFFGAWVEAVRQSGPGAIREIVVDDRCFDREMIHPLWPADQLNRWYCAEVGGLNFYTNTLALYARPTKVGSRPAAQVEPFAPWWAINNQARTTGKGSNSIWVSRQPESNQMTLYGDVRWRAEEPVWVALHDMGTLFGRLLADRLHDAGLGRPDVRRAAGEEDFGGARTIALVETPMEVVLDRCNTDSYNLYAECLLKRMAKEVTGRPGSWSAGAAVLRMTVEERLGPAFASRLGASDGSGMSRSNSVTPRLLAAWVSDIAGDDDLREPFLASLAAPSESGTMLKRFRDERPTHEVRAKTGYINGVSTLSGCVVEPSSGRTVVFSVLVNDIPGSVPLQRVKDLQERIVLLADDWLGEAAGAALGGE
jgi:D-alanyl-D-alanine carboxypeptidase/D-alanyl-D-alanine-endopeptidase (penicillin-binding protein 4)